MAHTGQQSSTIVVGGISIIQAISGSADGMASVDATLEAGIAGTLTTRTDNDTGVITVAEGHGVLDTDTVDIYWTGGCRLGMDVTAVDGTTISINLGSGDNLPTLNDAVVVGVQQAFNMAFDGDDAIMVGVSLNKRGHVQFMTAAPASLLSIELVADEGWSWVDGQGDPASNPLTGDAVATVVASCGEAAAGTFKAVVLYDSTP